MNNSQATAVDPISRDFHRVHCSLKLSGLKDTLPEHLVMARTQKIGHAEFLELLFTNELARRDSCSSLVRAR